MKIKINSDNKKSFMEINLDSKNVNFKIFEYIFVRNFYFFLLIAVDLIF